ncbi:venom metalloproteinase BumaMPs1 isoform X2 [Rhipicephalus microplus]|uniref:venom metalloproteinase BumaMPs1 isoform X2 n=1 Tax=Rhipicephalus microplus TaxID=6941 RepID=UPI003F6C7B95
MVHHLYKCASMFATHIGLWMTALAVSKQVHANADGLTVYPIVYEDREDKQKKFVVFDYDYSLELQKASVLAPRVLLRDYTENGVKDRYVDGAHYERHLYGNAENMASLHLKPNGRGRYIVVGLLNSTHYIEPITNQMNLMKTPHLISQIPGSVQDVRDGMIKIGAGHRENASPLDPRTQSIQPAIEVYVISDYKHTMHIGKLSLDPIQYIMTYMHKVSLELQQLKPPIRVVLVAYQSSSEKRPNFMMFTSTGNVDASGSVNKLREYASKDNSVQKSDFVLLFTECRLVDVSLGAEATEMLGIAPLEGMCNDYSVAVVKDTAGWYTGQHSTVHELGHLLGAYHDGEGSSTKCHAADGYIMSPKSYGANHEKFSSCSLAAISKYVRWHDVQSKMAMAEASTSQLT